MFSRFRNLFSKSKTEEEADSEIDSQTNRAEPETSASATNGGAYSGTILSEETETQLFQDLQKAVHETDEVFSDQLNKAASIAKLLNDLHGVSEVVAVEDKSNGCTEPRNSADAMNQTAVTADAEAIVADFPEDSEIFTKMPGTLQTIIEDSSSETSTNEAENVLSNQSIEKIDGVATKTNGIENQLIENGDDIPPDNSRETTDDIVASTDLPLTAEVAVDDSTCASEDSSTIYLEGPNNVLDDDSFDALTTTSLASDCSKVTSPKDSSDSSIVIEDLCAEMPPTPMESKDDLSTEGENAEAAVAAEPSQITINPIGGNALACNAIAQKLNEIAEVAESLDAAIRDVQHNAEVNEMHAGSTEKKLETLRSNSSEDWYSRSTEDESFATASEGNFTPHSHSSSFQTASGRTSSYIGSSKNSFDTSEADDSTFAFEMPELTSPLHNMSFDSSEHSFLSAQHSPSTFVNEDNDNQNLNKKDDDDNSVAGVEELRSQSVTPTPGDAQYAEGIPIESEHELESCINDAPTLEVLTETMSQTSVLPEVSASACSSINQLRTNTKPNAAWRRSKYYENITKQTIKGFL